MRIELIQSFLTVVEQGSLTRAAEKLYITQPTLSHRISELENQLGAKLIIRKKGITTIQLTPAGVSFIPQAEKWMNLLSETENVIKVASRETLSLTTSISVGSYLLDAFYPFILERFVNDCSLSLSMAPSIDIYQRIENHETDIAILCNTRFSNKAISLPIAFEEYVLICSKSSSLENIVHTGSLDPRKEIFIPWDSNTNLWHDYWFGNGATPFLKTECVLSLKTLLSHYDAWSIVPHSIAETLGESVKFCRLDDVPKPRTIYLVTQRKQKQPYCDIVKELLINTCPAIPALRYVIHDEYTN